MADIKKLIDEMVKESIEKLLLSNGQDEAKDSSTTPSKDHDESLINKALLGQKVIVRTYSAGVFFGTLMSKEGKEVILTKCRRLWRWKTKSGISLSEVSLTGIDRSESRICAPEPVKWTEAIEIIPCSAEAITSIESAPNDE